MIAHFAADALKLFGGGRALAQQAGHGVNHAAGIIVGGISRVLQLGGLGDVVHLDLLLLGRDLADRAQWWTLTINLWYPIIIFGIVPVIYAAKKLHTAKQIANECPV